MKDLNELFIPNELAVIAKEKGFNYPCIGFYDNNLKILIGPDIFNIKENKNPEKAIIYSQLIDWFENFNIYISTKIVFIGSDEWEHQYIIQYLPKEYQNEKRRSMQFDTIESFKESYGTCSGAWIAKNAALNAAIEHAFRLI